MAFRIRYPTLTELRCRACEIFGGTVVESREEAAELNSLPRLAMQIARGEMEPLAPGAQATIPPCVSPEELADIRERTGRPCPYTRLAPENYRVSGVMALALDNDPLAPVYFDASFGELGDDGRRRLMERVIFAKRCRQVVEAQEAARSAAAERARLQKRG